MWHWLAVGRECSTLLTCEESGYKKALDGRAGSPQLWHGEWGVCVAGSKGSQLVSLEITASRFIVPWETTILDETWLKIQSFKQQRVRSFADYNPLLQVPCGLIWRCICEPNICIQIISLTLNKSKLLWSGHTGRVMKTVFERRHCNFKS